MHDLDIETLDVESFSTSSGGEPGQRMAVAEPTDVRTYGFDCGGVEYPATTGYDFCGDVPDVEAATA